MSGFTILSKDVPELSISMSMGEVPFAAMT